MALRICQKKMHMFLQNTYTVYAYRRKLRCYTLAFRALLNETFLFQPHLSLFPNINLLLDLSGIFCMLAIHIFIFELSYLTAEFILHSAQGGHGPVTRQRLE